MASAAAAAMSETVYDTAYVSQAAAVVVACAMMVYLGKAGDKQRRRLPPGPPGLPVLGNLYAIMRRPKCEPLSNILLEWRKEYGDVMTIHLGSKPHVIISGADNIHEAQVAKANIFSDRPDTVAPFREDMHKAGLVFARSWREQRKAVGRILQNYGLGKTASEHAVQREVTCFIHELQRLSGNSKPCATDTAPPTAPGTPIFVHDLVTMAVCNVISAIMLGQRWEYDDKQYLTFERNFRLMAITNYKLAWSSFLKPIMWTSATIAEQRAQSQAAKEWNVDFTKKILGQHMSTLDPDNPRDFIDYYLIQVKMNAAQGLNNSLTAQNCVATILQMFSAGTNTTAMTLRWGYIYMMAHPDIQVKVQEELDEVVGDQELTIAHRRMLPYTEATITELLRMNHVAPLGLPKMANADTTIGGVFIPKGTTVYSHLLTAHRDEKVYPKPEQFRPERHLNKEGAFVHPTQFMPFSNGLRSCMGEQLARMELFLFFATTLQRFTLKKPEGHTLSFETYPDDSPKYQPMVLVPRQVQSK